jgi:hypothetical protein
MKDDELTRRMNNYERIIKEILGAFSKMEFHIVVESTIHKKIIPIDREDKKDKLLLEDIHTIANDFAIEYKQTPITFDLYKRLVKSAQSENLVMVCSFSPDDFVV